MRSNTVLHQWKTLKDSVKVPDVEQIDAWLGARESSVEGLKPGVHAEVIWAHPLERRPTPYSLVYLPGYTATRGEIAPVPDLLAAQLGANLFYARLTGHGTGYEGHRTASLEDWLRDGLEALEVGRRIGKNVILVATSTGATLACWLILGPEKARVAASVLVSPNLTPQNRLSELLLWPGRERLLKLIMGDTVVVPSTNHLSDRYWDTRHHSHSLIPMMELVDQARRLDFSQWSSPVLAVYDPADAVVNEKVTERLLSRVPSSYASLVRWKTAPGDHTHVIAGDALSPRGTQPLLHLIGEFLNSRLNVPLSSEVPRWERQEKEGRENS